jgi:hypothetical protein
MHQEAPKCTKMALCSEEAFALASASTWSADGGAAEAKRVETVKIATIERNGFISASYA